MNELNQHKKSDSIKWIITFVAIILLAVSVVALGAQVFGDGFMKTPITETTPENKTDETPINPDDILEPAEPNEGTGISTVKIHNSDMMKLAAKAPAAYSYADGMYIELNATVNPVGAQTGGYVWSVEWVNPNSEFANGKDVHNFIELEGEGETCYVSALAPFGEQIKITVSTVYNPLAKASCLVDYGQKWSVEQTLEVSTDVFFAHNTMYSAGSYSVYPIISASKQEMIDVYHNWDEICFSYGLEDVYTLDTCYDEFYYTLVLSEAFYDALCDAGLMIEDDYYHSFGMNAEISVAELLNAMGCGNIVPLGSNEEVDYALIYAFNQVANELDGELAFTIDVHAVSEYDDQNFCFDFYFDCENMTIIPDSIEISDTNIIL